MKLSTVILAIFVIPLALSAKDGEFIMPASAPRKVVPAAELTRKWSGETRSFGADKSATRSTLMSDQQLAKVRGAGADRGIIVVPVGNGQNQVSVNVDPDTSVSFPNILFKLNSTELADRDSAQQVEEIAKALVSSGEKSFVLEGHTCDLGTDQHNQGLSERRAAAIQAILTARGVAAARLTPMGFGEKEPALPNTSEANREQNRRVVISVKK